MREPLLGAQSRALRFGDLFHRPLGGKLRSGRVHPADDRVCLGDEGPVLQRAHGIEPSLGFKYVSEN